MLTTTNCASFQFSGDISKVRKRQHQYPEFGHTQGEIFKKPAKKHSETQGGETQGGGTQKTINFDGS